MCLDTPSLHDTVPHTHGHMTSAWSHTVVGMTTRRSFPGDRYVDTCGGHTAGGNHRQLHRRRQSGDRGGCVAAIRSRGWIGGHAVKTNKTLLSSLINNGAGGQVIRLYVVKAINQQNTYVIVKSWA